MSTILTYPANLSIIISEGGPEGFLGTAGRFNVVSYQTATSAITVSLNNFFVSVGEPANDTFTNIDGLIGTIDGDTLGGNDGANLIRGDAGKDKLWGMGGADMLEGGDGWDTAYYSTGVTVNLGGLYGIVSTGEAAGDVFDSIEGLFGSVEDDRLIGDGLDNILEGGKGSDTMIGGMGADLFHGSSQTDDPSDTGIDVVTYEYAGSAIAFDKIYGNGTVGEAAGDTFVNIEKVIGSRFNDTMGGSAAAETFEGGEGDDVLAGHGGADKLIGGNGFDFASYSRSDVGAVQVSLVAGASNTGGNAAGDVLESIEGLIGSKYGDKLTGNAGANKINGGLGKDVLKGGLGKDIFEFDTKLSSKNVDKIVDYNVKADTIHLENKYFTKLKAGKLPSSAYWTGSTAHDANDRIIYDNVKGKLYYDPDGTGAAKQVLFATLPTKLKMSAAEFHVI